MQLTLNVSELPFYVRTWGYWIWKTWAYAHQASIIHGRFGKFEDRLPWRSLSTTCTYWWGKTGLPFKYWKPWGWAI